MLLKSRLTFYCFQLVLFAWTQPSIGNELLRPRSAEELGKFEPITIEVANFVPGSRVAWADYGRILRDFPELKKDLELSTSTGSSLAHEKFDKQDKNKQDEDKINQWLISNFSFIGVKQKLLNGIRQSQIPEDKVKTTLAYRPKSWVRSAVLEAKSLKTGAVLGMVDVKGFGHGSRTLDEKLAEQVESFWGALKGATLQGGSLREEVDLLRTRGHSDGLMTFGEAGAEVTRQRAIQALLEAQELPLETVESYAIIELPFQILKEGGKGLGAALCLRQAHFGRLAQVHASADSTFLDPHGKKQGTASLSIVDFGGVVIPHFALKPHFAHAESKLDRAGRKTTPDAQYSNPWAWAHEAAGSGHEDAMRRHVADMDAAVERAIQTHSEAFRASNQFGIAERLHLAKKVAEEVRASGKPEGEWPELAFIKWFTAPEAFKSVLSHLKLLLKERETQVGMREKLFQILFHHGRAHQHPEGLALVEQVLSDDNVSDRVQSSALVALGNWDPEALRERFRGVALAPDFSLGNVAEFFGILEYMSEPSHLRTLLEMVALTRHRYETEVDDEERKHFRKAVAKGVRVLVTNGHGDARDLLEALEVLLRQVEERGKPSPTALACLDVKVGLSAVAARWDGLTQANQVTAAQEAIAADLIARSYKRCGSFGLTTYAGKEQPDLGRWFFTLLDRLIPDHAPAEGAVSEDVLWVGFLLKQPKAVEQVSKILRVGPSKEVERRIEEFQRGGIHNTCADLDAAIWVLMGKN